MVEDAALTENKVPWASQALVFAAVLFNTGLCFLNTAGWVHVGSQTVILCEALILGVGAYIVRCELVATATPIFFFALYMLALWLFNSAVDLKIVRDLAIPIIFYHLGRKSDTARATSTLLALAALVAAVALFEALFTSVFVKLFDIWSYYVSKGTLGSEIVNYGTQSLFLSATRVDDMGRTFFPNLFGSHRVSSVFLEPD